MSLKVSKLVRSRIIGSAPLKAVLLCMADRVDDDGGRFFKSRATIEGETELGRSTVKRALEQLVDMGLIECIGTRRCKNGRVNVYRLILSKIAALPEWKSGDEDDDDLSTTGFTVDPVQAGPGSQRTPRGSTVDPDGVQAGPQYVLESSMKQCAGAREPAGEARVMPDDTRRKEILAELFPPRGQNGLTDQPILEGEFLQ